MQFVCKQVITAILLWIIILQLEASEETKSVIAVIVSAQQAEPIEISPNDLSLVYWRKKLYTTNGRVLHPANLMAEHPLRNRFSQWVMHSSPKSQLNYWNGMYFHGVQPPYSVQSEEAMIRYVADTENGLGYVDACHLDERVKVLLWVNAAKISTEPPALHCDNTH